MAEERSGLSIIPYGLDFNAVELLHPDPEHPFLRLVLDGRTIETHLVGAYNAMNVLAAICVGCHFEVPFEDAVAAVESYVPANNRSQMQRTERNTLILDAYNANPSSMAVALESFALMEAPRKVALLGDMRELGDNSLEEHVKVVEKLAASGLEAYLVGEEFARALAAAGSPANVLGHFADSDALAAHLAAHPLEGACILVKGSRGIRMEKTIPSL